MKRWVLISAVALVGCGAGPEKADNAQPEAPPPPAPHYEQLPNVPDREVHIQDAQLELERAERALDLGITAQRTTPRKPPNTQVPSPTPGPTPGVKPPAQGGRPEAGSSCETACVALESMKRSAHYLCELSGGGDPRCTSAEDRVKRAERRVREVCGSCNEPAASLAPRRCGALASIEGSPLSTQTFDP